MSENEVEIDPDDLIIIEDNNNWKPPKDLILAYANQLGFDIANDPKELLSIAEKYLTKDIPDNIRRAFAKDNLQLVYINVDTKEIELVSEYEELAQEEYKLAKEKLLNEMREKEKEANKIIVMPRGKIAPIGVKKLQKAKIKKMIAKADAIRDVVSAEQYLNDIGYNNVCPKYMNSVP